MKSPHLNVREEALKRKFLSVMGLCLVASQLFIVATPAASSAVSPPDFLWVSQAGGASSDLGRCIAIDGMGNLYVVGSFYDTATFGTNVLSSAGMWDIFVAKYDQTGRILWVRQAGGSDWDKGEAIGVDSQGNCYVTGYFQKTVSFGSTNLTSAGGQDAFLARYDRNGVLQWDQAGGQGYGSVVAVDTNGNCYLRGVGAPEWGGTNYPNGFVARFTADGLLLWAQRTESNYSELSGSLALDREQNCYVTGIFYGNARFGGTIITGQGGWDMFLAKYDSAGTFQWVRQAGGGGSDGGIAIAVGSSGDCYVVGQYERSIRFGSTNLTSPAAYSSFLARYNSMGELQWLQTVGISGTAFAYAVATDTEDNCYVTGYFTGRNAFSITSVTSAGSADVFVAKYDRTGVLQWVQQAGGLGEDMGQGMVVDAAHNCYVIGTFGGVVTSGRRAIFGEISLTSVGHADVFIAKLGETLRFDTSSSALGIANKVLQLRLRGLSGQGSVILQASTNLVDWEPIFIHPPVIDILELADPTVTEHSMRFYRAIEGN